MITPESGKATSGYLNRPMRSLDEVLMDRIACSLMRLQAMRDRGALEIETSELRDALAAWMKTHKMADADCMCRLCVKSRAAMS